MAGLVTYRRCRCRRSPGSTRIIHDRVGMRAAGSLCHVSSGNFRGARCPVMSKMRTTHGCAPCSRHPSGACGAAVEACPSGASAEDETAGSCRLRTSLCDARAQLAEKEPSASSSDSPRPRSGSHCSCPGSHGVAVKTQVRVGVFEAGGGRDVARSASGSRSPHPASCKPPLSPSARVGAWAR